MEIFRPKPNVSLFYNAVQDSHTVTKYLIKFAIKNDVDSSYLLDSVCGKNPLYAAAKGGSYKIVKTILKYATDHGRRNAALLERDAEHGETPFQMALRKRGTSFMNAIFRFGLDNGVDVLKMDADSTALHFAIKEEFYFDDLRAIVTLARDNGVDAALLFQADSDGKTPLHLASCKTYAYWVDAVIKLARECGISAKSLIGPDETGNSPLHYAATNCTVNSLQAILNFAKDSGVDVVSLFQANIDRRTPLHCAATNPCHDTFNTLLSWGMRNGVSLLPILEPDSNGQTPLHLMASNHANVVDHEKAVILQCCHAANEHKCISSLFLQSAFERGKETVQAMLTPDGQGQTPLHLAARNDHKCMACLILQSAIEHGEDVVQVLLVPDGQGKTPLHLVLQSGYDPVPATRLIVELAAKFGKEMAQTILAPDSCGDTPLKLALESNCDSIYTGEVIMRFALENGVDCKTLIDIKDTALCSQLKEIFYNQIIFEPWIWPTLFPSHSR